MKKKRIIVFGVIALVCCIVISLFIMCRFKCYGEILNHNDHVTAFYVSRHYGDVRSCGGSTSIVYNGIVRDNKLYVYDTYLSTTGDNEYTTRYILDIGSVNSHAIRYCIMSCMWLVIYKYCELAIDASNDKTVVSKGMNDKSSRLPGGEYKWEVEFKELAELN